MDKFNVITPTDDLDALNTDMVNWCYMPYDFRKLSDDECIRMYGCTNIELYEKIKKRILFYKDARSVDYRSNLVTESSMESEYEDIEELLKVSASLQESPYIVIIDPNIENLDELNYRYNCFNQLSSKDRRLSNSYSMELWQYNVINMYDRVKKNIETKGIDIPETSNLIKESSILSITKPLLEECIDAIYNGNFIKSEILKYNIKNQSSILESQGSKSNMDRYYSDYCLDKIDEEFKNYTSFDSYILPDICPWLNSRELKLNNIYFESESFNYKNLKTANDDELIKYGWTKYYKPENKDIFNEAKERQSYYIESHAPIVMDISNAKMENGISSVTSNMSPILLCFNYAEPINTFTTKIKYDKVGILIDKFIYTFTGADNLFKGFIKETINDYNNIEIYAMYIDNRAYQNIINNILSNNNELYNGYNFTSTYSYLLNNIKNPNSIDAMRIVFLQYLELLLKISEINDDNSEFSIASNIKYKFNMIYKLYSGNINAIDYDRINKTLDVISDNDTNGNKSICIEKMIFNDDNIAYDNKRMLSYRINDMISPKALIRLNDIM